MKRGRVFDTNVLFAAQFAKGVCAQLYEEALRDEPPITSKFILDELQSKLVSKLHLTLDEAVATRKEIEGECRNFVVSPLANPVCRDPDDDMILATAVSGGAEMIVTGDKDLLTIEVYAGIRILTPAECLAELRQES